MASVRFDGIRKVYENGHIGVAGASFEVADGELLVLVGPSGCGKSTLLRMIAGLESITSGTLSIGDKLVNDVLPKDRDIAMVFQSYALYPHMTVAENLGFGLKMRNLPKAEIERRIQETAGTLGLTSMLGSRPRELSGGQRQRVALGRALVRNPAVFLLDEPLSNLDAKLRLSMRVEIARLHRQFGATMIYVTHDQIEAMTLGERIVVLNQGRIQQIDTPMRLYARPANLFVAGFVGSPAMNLLRGRLVLEGGARLETETDSLPLAGLRIEKSALAKYIGREIVVGLRPEGLHLVDNGGTSAEPKISARLDAVEAVGNEVFLNMRFGSIDLVARVPPISIPTAGRVVRLQFAVGSLHFFEVENDGLRIDPQPDDAPETRLNSLH